MGDLSPGQPPTMASFLTLTCSQRFSPLREERALSLWLPGSLGFFSSAENPGARVETGRDGAGDEDGAGERARRRAGGWEAGGEVERDRAASGFYNQNCCSRLCR